VADNDHDAARTRDAERLRALEARLGERVQEAPPARGDEHFSQANMAWRMVTELVAGLGIGFLIGFGLGTI
jgi:ATP synthase protein I